MVEHGVGERLYNERPKERTEATSWEDSEFVLETSVRNLEVTESDVIKCGF